MSCGDRATNGTGQGQHNSPSRIDGRELNQDRPRIRVNPSASLTYARHGARRSTSTARRRRVASRVGRAIGVAAWPDRPSADLGSRTTVDVAGHRSRAGPRVCSAHACGRGHTGLAGRPAAVRLRVSGQTAAPEEAASRPSFAPSDQTMSLAHRRAEPPRSFSPADIQRLTDQIVRVMDQRLVAHRERFGRT